MGKIKNKIPGKYIKIKSLFLTGFGLLKDSVYYQVECPDEFKNKYGDSTWVYSPTRKEPVRLTEIEFEINLKREPWKHGFFYSL